MTTRVTAVAVASLVVAVLLGSIVLRAQQTPRPVAARVAIDTDDIKAGWKGRGLWAVNGMRPQWHVEGGKGTPFADAADVADDLADCEGGSVIGEFRQVFAHGVVEGDLALLGE